MIGLQRYNQPKINEKYTSFLNNKELISSYESCIEMTKKNDIINIYEEVDNGGSMARVLVSMPEDFLGKIDKVAVSEGRTRSELIREALRGYIRKNSMSTSNEKAIYEAKELEKILG